MPASIFKKSVTNFYLLLLLTALSVSTIVLDLKYPNSNYIRVFVNDFIINPIQYVTKTPASFFNNLMIEKETIASLNIQIETLKKENISMKINLQRIDVLENEVTRLRSIKKKVNNTIKNIKIAKITQRNVIPNKESIQIGIGSDQNIKLGQTVMSVNGLIGQIVEVSMFSSKILLITDSNSNVPAQIVRTGSNIIIKGRAQDNKLEISFLPTEADVKTGDLIVTSGQGGRFISSIKIGRITKIDKNEGERFAKVLIETLVNFDDISEVVLSIDEN